MASQKTDLAKKSQTTRHDLMSFRVGMSSLFLTFALSLSLGEMGVLRMLSESGAHGFTCALFFVFDETPVKVPAFGQQPLPTITH
jgi:hypothetical protein